MECWQQLQASAACLLATGSRNSKLVFSAAATAVSTSAVLGVCTVVLPHEVSVDGRPVSEGGRE